MTGRLGVQGSKLRTETTGHITMKKVSMPRPNVREQLLDAALDRFHALGFNGCGVQEITDAAGVPKGSFYNHFESKEAMALEALDRFWQNGARRREVLDDNSLDPVERLRRYFRSMADAMVRARFRGG